MKDNTSVKMPIDNEIFTEFASRFEDFSAALRFFYNENDKDFTIECYFRDGKIRPIEIDCSEDDDLYFYLTSSICDVSNNSIILTDNATNDIDKKTKKIRFKPDDGSLNVYIGIETQNESFANKIYRLFNERFKELEKGQSSITPKEKD